MKAIMTRYRKKLLNLHNKKFDFPRGGGFPSYIKSSVFNMTLHDPTEEDYQAISYGLDYHFPTKTNKNF